MITVYGYGGALVSGSNRLKNRWVERLCTPHCSTSHCPHSWCSGRGHRPMTLHSPYDSRSTLIVMRGTLTGQRYVDDILQALYQSMKTLWPSSTPCRTFPKWSPWGNFPAR
ncbi:hypothetical protein TNCV_1473371 [Trichonephila clavipes]|nr:hypothetical protein TNCV_1473371 [Trichonephila clavipes]